LFAHPTIGLASPVERGALCRPVRLRVSRV